VGGNKGKGKRRNIVLIESRDSNLKSLHGLSGTVKQVRLESIGEELGGGIMVLHMLTEL